MFVQEMPNKTIDNYQIAESHWILPEDFRVYVCGNVLVNYQRNGFDEKILPTLNHYREADGRYVSIDPDNAEKGVYGVGGDIYVIGDEKILPTFNHYRGTDGGYVAIYTHNEEKGVYGVGDDIYVIGQVRIQGEYKGRIFVPVGYRLGDNITRDPDILAICEEYFPDMKREMWVGGDTGGWFGGTSRVDGCPGIGKGDTFSYDDWRR